MVAAILLSLSLLSILFIVVIGVAFTYHFRRFGLPDDPIASRILNIFKIGCLVLVGLNIFFLILNLLKL